MSSESDNERKEEQTVTTQNGKNYVINLQSFSRYKMKLSTELRNCSGSRDILDTYCADKTAYEETNPFLSPDGAHPLMIELYKYNREGEIRARFGRLSWSDNGRKLTKEISTKLENETPINEMDYDDLGISIGLPTPDQIHIYPTKSWKQYQRYLIESGRTIETGLKKSIKKWLHANHRLFSTIIGRLKETDMHTAGGIEMSHGAYLYKKILMRYGHTHAQCLATLLKLITTLKS